MIVKSLPIVIVKTNLVTRKKIKLRTCKIESLGKKTRTSKTESNRLADLNNNIFLMF